ncbi:MAG: hypothetical protein R3255_09770 [Candidatus Lokiarchaeia archaeon]|nr:hypothetical protein [Candidatus Lokiarchaeia archaeon]
MNPSKYILFNPNGLNVEKRYCYLKALAPQGNLLRYGKKLCVKA